MAAIGLQQTTEVTCPHELKFPDAEEERLKLVSDFTQEIFAEFDVGFGFDASGFQAVNHAEDTAPLLGLGDNDLDGIRRGAENPAHLGRS